MILEKGNIEGIKHFKKEEFFCKDMCELTFKDINLDVVKLADRIRESYGAPVFIDSSLRCPYHNAEVGGKRFSYHLAIPDGVLLGRALDIRPERQEDLLEFKKICDTLNPNGGCGLSYPSFVHIDIGPKRRW